MCIRDSAYCVPHLSDDEAEQDRVLDIGAACREAKNPHRYFKFASTSKVTHPGAGISGIAASPENIAEIKKRVGDKLKIAVDANQGWFFTGKRAVAKWDLKKRCV